MTSDSGHEPSQAELDELEADIEEVRHEVQPEDDGPRYYESGSENPDEDDQTIAPG